MKPRKPCGVDIMSRSLFLTLVVAGVAFQGCGSREPTPETPTETPAHTAAPSEAVRVPAPEKGQPGRKQTLITISRETTYLTAPLDDRGYVDYVEALNQQMSEGVTPETNAAVPFWQALGPGTIPEEIRTDYFRRLGIDPLPLRGNYFIPLEAFATLPPSEAPSSTSLSPEDIIEAAELTRKGPWKPAEFPEIADWLEANNAALERISKGATRTRAYFPCTAGDSRESQSTMLYRIPYVGAVETAEAAEAICSRAMLHLGAGRTREAAADLMACHRLAELVGTGFSMVDQYVMIRIHAAAFEGDAQLALVGQLSAAQARESGRNLATLNAVSAVRRTATLRERYEYLEFISQMAANGELRLDSLLVGGPEQRVPAWRILAAFLIVDWDSAMEYGNRSLDRMSAIIEIPDRRKRSRALDQFYFDRKTERMQWHFLSSLAMKIMRDFLSGKSYRQTAGEFVGTTVLEILDIPATYFAGHENRMIARHILVRLAYALSAYHADHGKYPDRLFDLVPRDIEEIPDDPFTRQPLWYHRKGSGYLLYSVGENATDDGGAEQTSDPPGDDIVIRAASE